MSEWASNRPRTLLVGVTVGGSAYSLLRGQLAWLKSNGWDVTLVSTPDEMAYQAAARESVPLVGVRMHRNISPTKDLIALARWIALLHRYRPHAVSVGTPKAALLGITSSWMMRVRRRLYVVRGLRLEGSNGAVARLLWMMEWVTMTLATDVLFVSRSLANEASRRRLLPRRKSWVIGAGSSNGVDSNAIAARVEEVNRDELRTSLGFSEDHFVVGFIGRVTPDKGVETLLTACRNGNLAPRVRVLIIGALESAELGTEIAALEPVVRRLSWTEDVWGNLPALDALCLPTFREGFPNVVLEAAAAGLPTITTRVTGAVDSVLHEKTGILIDPGDADALAARMNQLADDQAWTRSLGIAAKNWVAAEFQQERIWLGLHEILKQEPNPVEAVRFAKNP